MRRLVPAPVIAAVADVLAEAETHASLDNLFMHAGAPGDPPAGNKTVKTQEWIRRINRDESIEPLELLGRLIEVRMEADCDADGPWSERCKGWKEKIERALARTELQYVKGGRVAGALGTPSRTLEDLIRGRDLAGVDEEFSRALRNVDVRPREAVSAAGNVLESLCKIYIEEHGLEMPRKQDLPHVWAVVRDHLGFDPARVEDRDLKEILSGLLAVVSGIGALRTHASSAHGASGRGYRLEGRHARLAIHAAHTIAAFIIEAWQDREARPKS